MKKIITLILFLLLTVGGFTWFYFKSLKFTNGNSEKILRIIPTEAAFIFEYKNEASYYQIFKNFTLYKDILGNNCYNQLNNLETVFINNPLLGSALENSNLYFSLHKTTLNNAGFLVFAHLNQTFLNNNTSDDFIKLVFKNKKIINKKISKAVVYTIEIKNAPFYFFIYQNILVASFDTMLLQRAIKYTDENIRTKIPVFESQTQRNKNAIANLYVNFAKLPDFLNNFSKYKNPDLTAHLKNFKAYASLNINYQSDAFMFSGITTTDTLQLQYANIFLSQQPGKLTLNEIVPLNASSYTSFYVSDMRLFQSKLKQMFKQQNVLTKLKTQLNTIAKKHSVPIEKEFLKVLGNEFGQVQLASGDKIGLASTTNSQRLTFLLSTISTPVTNKIAKFDDSNFLYYFFGEPFKSFGRPYFAIVSNYLVVANSASALNNFLIQYQQQQLISATAKYTNFEQYLSNKGNIFYFLHTKNSKTIFKSFLSENAYNNFKSDNFKFDNIYGLSIQFSADKNKFYTNLYMNRLNPKSNVSTLTDSLYLDSLTK